MKIMRNAALVLALTMALMMLSSCNMLDELKAKRAIILDEGTERLELDGEMYVLLDTENLSDDRVIKLRSNKLYYAVKESFPLLLMEKFGLHCYMNYEFDIMYICDAVDTYYYAPEDMADEYNSIINDKSELKNYKINLNSGVSEGAYITERYMFSEELTAAINYANDGAKSISIRAEYDDRYDWFVISIDRCDAHGLVQSIFQQNIYKDPEGNYGVVLGASNDNSDVLLDVVKLGDEFDEELEMLFSYAHVDSLYFVK